MTKLVFFSGGTALGRLASYLAPQEIQPVYIITTFDSGGSTQALRKVISMPAVGDLRNRLLAATDTGLCPRPLIRFLKFRLGARQSFQDAREELQAKIDTSGLEDHEEWIQIKADLDSFIKNMPLAFDARNASMGNLAITGNWFANGRSLKAAIDRYRRLLHVNAHLIPVCEQDLHLGFRLENKQTLVGQHLLHENLPSPISHIFLTRTSPWQEHASYKENIAAATEDVLTAIANADTLCFPMGSFFSSLVATLLPSGIGRAIAASRAVKIYIPNSGYDVELSHLDLPSQIETLLTTLKTDAPDSRPQDLLTAVLMDRQHGQYNLADFTTFACYLAAKGILLRDQHVIAADGSHNPEALIAAIEELAGCASK